MGSVKPIGDKIAFFGGWRIDPETGPKMRFHTRRMVKKDQGGQVCSDERDQSGDKRV